MPKCAIKVTESGIAEVCYVAHVTNIIRNAIELDKDTPSFDWLAGVSAKHRVRFRSHPTQEKGVLPRAEAPQAHRVVNAKVRRKP